MNIRTLQETIGITFKDTVLLGQALVHDSYVNENPEIAPTSNERLEFLGDAMLGLIVAEKLYHDFPDYAEGQMTQLRASLVRRDTLARLARTIGLGDYLYLGKGEEGSGGRDKIPNLAGALEALIGAIYLDQGPDTARQFTLRLMGQELERLGSSGAGVDYKSQLQELVQSQKQHSPTYSLVEATGPDHDRWFTIEVKVGETVLGRGSGRSKKVAESEAARVALERLRAES
ncbi:MAG: ribonuclease III [Chloroflexi bacterium RBG_16_57_8]|nr:MAG: ribonuclease III [Chloroflexi bacterium RBG_16_57_8]